MEIRYQKGDVVYDTRDYGGFAHKVIEVRKRGLLVENRVTGERLHLGKREVEPHPSTVQRAKWLPQEASS